MQRMSIALRRAAAARPFGAATDRALRWAAAWGMVAGIRTPHTHLRLRRSTLIGVSRGPPAPGSSSTAPA